jgi:ketosteroid isomerase-like protein
MSEENVEIVREVMELMNRAASGGQTGADALLDRFAADVRIDMSRRVFNPDVYEGHDGLRRLGAEVQEVWGEFRIEPEQFVDAGDRVIVIEVRLGRGSGSGVEVEQRSGVIWTLRDGKVVGMETDLDPEEALEAAGEQE